VPVIYGEGGIAAAMGSTMPTTANPTAQGMISVISFAVNVFISVEKTPTSFRW